MELIKNNIKVEWVDLNEGLGGEYDPNDPSDIGLLRFDVSKFVYNKWVEIPDASYCTNFPVLSSQNEQSAALRIIMDEIYEPASMGYSIKKICERLSWISPEWLT